MLELQGQNHAPIISHNISIGPKQRYRWSHIVDNIGNTISLEWQKPDNFLLDNKVYAILAPQIRVWHAEKMPAEFISICRYIPGLQDASNPNEADYVWIPLQESIGVDMASLAPQGHSHTIQPHSEPLAWLLSKKNLDHWFIQSANLACVSDSSWIISGHPILKAVHPSFWQIQNAYGLPMESLQGEALISNASAAILAVGKDWLFIGFAPQHTQWPTLPCFPIFWRNLWDTWEPQRGRFVYDLSTEANQKPGLYTSQAVNFLIPQESANAGKLSLLEPTEQLLHSISQANTLFHNIQRILVCLGIVGLAILWIWPFMRV